MGASSKFKVTAGVGFIFGTITSSSKFGAKFGTGTPSFEAILKELAAESPAPGKLSYKVGLV